MIPADAKPACAEPALLPLVDLSFDRSKKGNAAARELVEVACKHCPVSTACMNELIRDDRSHGVWGGGRRVARSRVSTSTTVLGPIKVVAA